MDVEHSHSLSDLPPTFVLIIHGRAAEGLRPVAAQEVFGFIVCSAAELYLLRVITLWLILHHWTSYSNVSRISLSSRVSLHMKCISEAVPICFVFCFLNLTSHRILQYNLLRQKTNIRTCGAAVMSLTSPNLVTLIPQRT